MNALPTPLLREVWLPGDQRWSIAARRWEQSGYATVSDLAEAMRLANPAILDWSRVAPGSVVLVPTLPGNR